MNILLLGSGGREHALAWKLAQSPRCSRLFVAPGNAGTALVGTNVSMSVTNFDAIGRFVLEQQVGLVVVGPEEPLVKGIRDFFEADANLKQVPLIGPSQLGAQLEGSKDFAKAFLTRHHIPTARYKTFTSDNLEEGYTFIDSLPAPYVLKADGLAAGKGVVILEDAEAAKAELKEMIVGKKFGAASTQVVIEEFLRGIELSVFVLTDGRSYRLLPEAKDYKRIGDRDTGPNTGGMGAVSPVPFATPEFLKKVEERIVVPTVQGLAHDGIAYNGFIFIGLMNVGGDPYVIEYNVRMGDPETEAVIPRITGDLVELLLATGQGRLSEVPLAIDPRTAVTVVLVSGGYPNDYKKGIQVSGHSEGGESLVFHAGTSGNERGEVVTNGGRVFAITSFGRDIASARALSYAMADKIRYEGKYHRTDIGLDLLGEH
ncbi:MAG: phosphoribosylamine--glycine ligase [Bacteroidia bacterium]|jgi:phosphoribosylamine--glycine ligase|nr:phosphoribosylamine--glycine ligase [Bacteroidia bacterium]MBP7728161.1 phosphoribosylamine--glycine ligase [Bacteroidia bacterium]MBP7771342.1 phosphoribosylamine--glycine ligase [Bacteroidia bacterium]HRS38895.1 phosphoribosylamine--glycine ligase [Bacteroidia bacterium]HRU60544.1 phosphoribosylamine--glycine ligase [Bacteroidia bacterium]